MFTSHDHEVEQILGRLERVSLFMEDEGFCDEITPGTWAYNYWERVKEKLQKEKARLLY